MATQTVELNIQPLERRLAEARRRLWWQRSALTMARAVCASLAVALVAALLAAWQAPAQLLGGLWTATTLPLAAGLAAALLLRPSHSEAARAMDDSLGLAQQIGTAEELLTRGATGGLVHMQISRAVDVAESLVVSSAFPLLPRKETPSIRPFEQSSQDSTGKSFGPR